MTADEVRARVAEIARRAKGINGSPTAHAMEDDLRAEVLQAIADGAADAADLARAALETTTLGFSRWYE